MITGVVDPSHGTLSYDLTQITYTPAAGYNGSDAFSYTISDGNGGVANGNVSVTVRQPGSDPGFSLKFDGVSDVVTLTNTSTMLPAGWQTTKTVELWVKPTGTYACTFPSSAHLRCHLRRSLAVGISRAPTTARPIWVWNWDTNLDAVGIPTPEVAWPSCIRRRCALRKNGVLVGSVRPAQRDGPSCPHLRCCESAASSMLTGGRLKADRPRGAHLERRARRADYPRP
jgi:hypothetical protein